MTPQTDLIGRLRKWAKMEENAENGQTEITNLNLGIDEVCFLCCALSLRTFWSRVPGWNVTILTVGKVQEILQDIH